MAKLKAETGEYIEIVDQIVRVHHCERHRETACLKQGGRQMPEVVL